MLLTNSPNYLKRITESIESIKHTIEYWRNFQIENGVCLLDYVILLTSMDEDINYFTLHYLEAFRILHKVHHFFIVTHNPNLEIFVRQNTTVPYTFVCIQKKDSDALAWLYSIRKFTDRLIINSFELSADKDIFCLVNNHDILKSDIVARVVLQLEDTPSETDLATGTEEVCVKSKAINWLDPHNMPPIKPEVFTNLSEIVNHAIDPLIKNGQITQDDQLVLFGVTQTARTIAQQLNNYSIIAYADNNKTRTGETVENVPVLLPEDCLKPFRTNVKILVCSRQYKLICEQLYALGYELGKQVFIAYSINQPASHFEPPVEDSILEELAAGRAVYEKLRETYPSQTLLVRPFQGTGDVYLLGGYIRQILETNLIKDYVLTVISGSIKKTAELFNIPTTICPQDDAFFMLRFARSVGFEYLSVFSLNDNLDQNDFVRIRGYRNLDSHTIFHKLVFGCSVKTNKFNFYQENSDALFAQYQLKKGRTILLSPYAITIPNLPTENWEHIVHALLDHGYNVCTNVSSESEQTIPGTRGIFIPYKQVVDFVNKAGGFIGLRNGLCDILSSSCARIALFYPHNQIRPGSFYYNCYSLVRMGLKYKNLLELEYEDKLSDDNISQTIAFMTRET